MIKAMSQTGLNLFIPMELLINSLNALSLSEKQQLWQILDEAIGDAEEDDWREIEINPEIAIEKNFICHKFLLD
jgi:hypothetical protein